MSQRHCETCKRVIWDESPRDALGRPLPSIDIEVRIKAPQEERTGLCIYCVRDALLRPRALVQDLVELAQRVTALEKPTKKGKAKPRAS